MALLIETVKSHYDVPDVVPLYKTVDFDVENIYELRGSAPLED